MLNTHATQHTPHRCKDTNISFLGVNKRYSCTFFYFSNCRVHFRKSRNGSEIAPDLQDTFYPSSPHTAWQWPLQSHQSWKPPHSYKCCWDGNTVKPQGWELGYFSISYPQITQTKFITQRLSSFLKTMENKDFPTSSITTYYSLLNNPHS